MGTPCTLRALQTSICGASTVHAGAALAISHPAVVGSALLNDASTVCRGDTPQGIAGRMIRMELLKLSSMPPHVRLGLDDGLLILRQVDMTLTTLSAHMDQACSFAVLSRMLPCQDVI